MRCGFSEDRRPHEKAGIRALTAYLYRKYTDLYLTGGREHYHVDQADLER